ncbi:MAG TPA: hypothetical protein VD962_05545 [Rubricoccaceae bacterium]|nr:hypothetical protein [Rubricoccaceae bacterium]
MHRLLFLLVLALLAGGCRESLVDVNPGPGPSGIPPSTTDPLYLKGPGTLVVGDEANYRGQSHHDAAQYRWIVSGSGVLQGDFNSGTRFLSARAVDDGEITLVVHALDAEGRLVGEGERTIQIVRR